MVANEVTFVLVLQFIQYRDNQKSVLDILAQYLASSALDST
jgi:hypothetical protein